LAQVVYYFSSAVSLGAPERSVSFTVPTGNFGDIFAGYIAKHMGLPIEDLVIATNQNDILHRCLSTGEYRMDKVLPSYSPSMDIQISSNFERALFDAYDRDGAAVAQLMDALKTDKGFSLSQGIIDRLRQNFSSGAVSEQETLDCIRETMQNTGEILCPHSAIGVHVAGQQRNKDVAMITLATAHPAKFPDAVENASGTRPALPERMSDLFQRDERLSQVSNNLDEITSLIKDRITS